jgi:hypothetical protein
MIWYLGLTGSTVPENPPSTRFFINALPMVPAFSLAPTTAFHLARVKDAVSDCIGAILYPYLTYS